MKRNPSNENINKELYPTAYPCPYSYEFEVSFDFKHFLSLKLFSRMIYWMINYLFIIASFLQFDFLFIHHYIIIINYYLCTPKTVKIPNNF